LIDFDLEITMIQPINIKEMELTGYKIDDNIKKSIVLYNIAIGEINKGNVNLAINDLKKALSYNKDFLEATKLMGLCYVNIKEYKKAEKIFKKLAKYQIYDELVNEYMQSLEITKSKFKNINTIKEVKYISNNKQFIAAKCSKGKISIGLLIFIILTGVIIHYFYPLTIQTVLTKSQIRIQSIVEKFQVNNKIVNSTEKIDENATLSHENIIADEDYENVQEKLQYTDLESDSSNNKDNIVNMLNDAEKSFNDGNYEKAASTLISMKSMNFDAETKKTFDQLWKGLTPNALWTIYNQGNKLYKQKNYVEALPKLKIASEIDPNLELMPWIIFQIGMCYKETNDKVNALIYFNNVQDNYPRSKYSSNAKMMINLIES
jgi:tetratricopeptide (TPR) repeat protein